MSTPETATSAVGPWRRSPPPLAPGARTTRLPDNLYARVGEKPAEAAREDFGTARAIGEGECALDGDRPFRRARADEQLEALKGVEGSDFLELVRSTAVVEVYSDRRTWQVFG